MAQKDYFSSVSDNELVATQQTLYDFIQEYGTPGVMPTSTELRQAGRRDLDQAINQLGGYDQIAKQWGLTLKYMRKPSNYWKDFSNVEKELLAFIAEYGTPSVMPIKAELLKAGRGDLAKAIIKTHGGIEAVAERLGLQLPSHKRKKRGYWEDFANVTSELQNFIAEHGVSGVMPTQNDLTRVGLSSLANAIDYHGGIYAVAQRLGLCLSHTQHPNGYWDDFVNVERELLAFVSEHGTPGVMPSRGDLRQAGLHDLNGALEKHGGTPAVAKRLNLKPKIKPMGHWDDFTNVEKALSAYIAEHGIPGVMPTHSELQRAGQSSLSIVITKKHGGVAHVAERLGLQLPSTAKPSSYWDDIAHIELAIREFNEARRMPGVMPTGSELKKAGRTDLASAITNHGGFPALAEQFGLLYTYTAKPDRYWEDFANVQQEILDFNKAQGISGRMPTTIELRDAGRHSLAVAINAHGGFPVVAKRFGLVTKTKPNGYWDDFANLEQELLTFIQEHGKQGVMPTNQEFYAAKRSDLSFAIHKHGGATTVRERLGLRTPPKRPGPWDDFSRVEQELYTFIDTQGTAGVMPTREQLKQAERSDLIAAIDTHGGSFIVAQRLRLQLTSGNKPNGYWDDFSRVEEAIRRFLATSHNPKKMPTLAQLKQSGQGDLVSAIAKHGGIGVVAQRLGLQLSSSSRPDGYWSDFSHVRAELRSFIEEQGNIGIMPTTAQLEDAGYGNLLHGIIKHGGLVVVAQRLGLKNSSTVKPNGYWNDFTHIEQELRQYIHEQGTNGVMPTQSELNQAHRQDLINAIRRFHGGFTVVAQRLGLQQRVSSKQPGYWTDFANVERELKLWIATYGSPGTMPALQVLRMNGQTSLASAIAQHGGFPAVAQRLGLIYTYTAKPAGYWDDFSHIEQAVNAFIEEYGTHGVMPTRGELRDAGWHDLEIALGKHGGSVAVAERMGLQLSYTKRAMGYWKDFANVERELLDFINADGTAGLMPSRDELHAVDFPDSLMLS